MNISKILLFYIICNYQFNAGYKIFKLFIIKYSRSGAESIYSKSNEFVKFFNYFALILKELIA